MNEINLAPVEKWFSEFISKMESGDDLILYDESETTVAETKSIYKSRYKLNNIKFIGTMNENETDDKLNLRVLDRASKVTLGRPDLAGIINTYITNKKIKVGKQMQRFIDIANDLNDATETTTVFLRDRNREYASLGKFSISPRVVITSLKYLESAENIEGSEQVSDDLVDLLFCQKVFSKITVNDNLELVKRWRDSCAPDKFDLKIGFETLNRLFH